MNRLFSRRIGVQKWQFWSRALIAILVVVGTTTPFLIRNVRVQIALRDMNHTIQTQQGGRSEEKLADAIIELQELGATSKAMPVIRKWLKVRDPRQLDYALYAVFLTHPHSRCLLPEVIAIMQDESLSLYYRWAAAKEVVYYSPDDAHKQRAEQVILERETEQKKARLKRLNNSPIDHES